MLTVTARIFNDTQLVGYRLSDGNQERDFTKLQAWVFAKNKQILNVIATGNESDPGLSGTNGFELKRLPEVKPTNTHVKYDTQDLEAAGIRLVMNGFNPASVSSRDELMSAYKNRLKQDVQNGVIGAHNVKKLSTKFVVMKALQDQMDAVGAIGVATTSEEDLQKQRNEFNERKQQILALLDKLKTLQQKTINDIQSLNGTDDDRTVKIIIVQSLLKILTEMGNFRTIAGGIASEDLDKASQELDELRNGEDANFDAAKTTDAMRQLGELISETEAKISETEFKPRPQLCSTAPVIGYIVKYEGSTPIQIQRLDINTNAQEVVTLAPNEIICLSRAEMAMLGARPEMGCTFSNGKLVSSSKLRLEKYKYLSGFYFAVEKGFDRLEKVNVQDVADVNTIKKYFIKSTSTTGTANNSAKKSTSQETVKKLQNSKGILGMMKAVDRK